MDKDSDLYRTLVEEGALIAEGFDEAIIGIGYQFNKAVVVYNYDKCVEVLAKDMSFEEAEEFFEYNVLGSYVGEKTPVFLKIFKE